MNSRHIPAVAAVVLAISVSAGCGGGSGTSGDSAPGPVPAAAETPVPSTALTSPQVFDQALQLTDTIEPKSLQQQLPPVSDTTEPFSIT